MAGVTWNLGFLCQGNSWFEVSSSLKNKSLYTLTRYNDTNWAKRRTQMLASSRNWSAKLQMIYDESIRFCVAVVVVFIFLIFFILLFLTCSRSACKRRYITTRNLHYYNVKALICRHSLCPVFTQHEWLENHRCLYFPAHT